MPRKIQRFLLRNVIRKQNLRYLIVNAFTISSMLLGMVSLISTVTGYLPVAALCLLGCVLLDGCDGNLARKWNVASSFGAQLDSLADMTAFGVAGSVLTYYWLSQKSPAILIIAIVSGLLLLMGAIRLARFNVSPKDDRYFQGIPTTVVAAIIAATYLTSPNLPFGWAALLVGLLAVLMVSAFPYFKFTQLRRMPKWVPFIVMVGGLIDLPATVLIVASVYIFSGPVLWWRQHRV